MTALPPGSHLPPGLGRPFRPLPRGQLKAALEPSPTGRRDCPSARGVNPRTRLAPGPRPPRAPEPLPERRSPAYLAGGQGRAAGSGGRAGAGRGPGARCRWRRRRLRLLSLQLPLSPAPPPPPPPAFPRGLPCCQERPHRGSASFGVSQVSSSRRRRQGRGPRPAPARSLPPRPAPPERSR